MHSGSLPLQGLILVQRPVSPNHEVLLHFLVPYFVDESAGGLRLNISSGQLYKFPVRQLLYCRGTASPHLDHQLCDQASASWWPPNRSCCGPNMSSHHVVTNTLCSTNTWMWATFSLGVQWLWTAAASNWRTNIAQNVEQSNFGSFALPASPSTRVPRSGFHRW